ncbi:MAG TPA: SRPBCC family protein [Jiangellaceae bacterium]|nr:SRPBCC family protein [Jiangellaceae bacterium]
MRLEHEFTVPVPVEQAWDVLLDVERVAPCMPGATIESVEGDNFTGKVKVRVGPVTVAYTGTASFLEKDAAARRVVVQAKGRETRGAGTAAATVTAVLQEIDEGTKVNVETNLAITGRPAQFGRGVMDEVGAKLLGQFADCLADRLGAGEPVPAAGESAAGTAGAAAPAGGEPTGVGESAAAGESEAAGESAGRGSRPAGPRPTPDTINLVQVAGGSVAKRVLPVIAVIAGAIIVWVVVRGLRG